MLRSYKPHVLGASLARQIKISQPHLDQPTEYGVSGQVAATSRVVVTTGQVLLQRPLGRAPVLTRGLRQTQLTIVVTEPDSCIQPTAAGGDVGGLAERADVSAWASHLGSPPLGGQTGKYFGLGIDPRQDVLASELHMSSHSDAARPFPVDAPVVDGRDRHTEVAGQVLHAQRRLQAAHSDELCRHARQVDTGLRTAPSRSGATRSGARVGGR